MPAWTWSDRLLVVSITLVFTGVGALVGWLFFAKAGAIFGPVLIFPITQIVLIKTLKNRYAERPNSRP